MDGCKLTGERGKENTEKAYCKGPWEERVGARLCTGIEIAYEGNRGAVRVGCCDQKERGLASFGTDAHLAMRSERSRAK